MLLCAADGIGTKVLVARKLSRFDTLGIDLVAMCANDLLVSGAAPFLFQDYIACGRIDEETLHPVMRGIVKGCELAQCELSGGETAELPDMYGRDDFDLAGFCTGLVEKDRLLPKTADIEEGDVLLGLPSSGIHSNGLSLARGVLSEEEEWLELLSPTRIYRREMDSLLSTDRILAAAHITGGGLFGNLRRVLPAHLQPLLSFDWSRSWIFDRIQSKGKISDEEMRRVFNMGIGIALVAAKEHEAEITAYARDEDIELVRIGDLGPLL
jgi:phosphoribosylformylglycinamidine cyclo-ligase